MGHSQTEKTRNHDRIVEIAARRIREQGTDGPGVAEIMREAGLTHGGFYKHFGSRDELVAEAARRSYDEAERAVGDLLVGTEDPLRAFVGWYLSEAHRDDPGTGCPVVALGGDDAPGAALPRSPERATRVRRGYGPAVDARRRLDALARGQRPGAVGADLA